MRVRWVSELISNEKHNKELPEGAAPQSNKMSLLVGIYAAVGGWIMGYDTGLINNILAMSFVKRKFSANHVNFSADEMALVTCMLSLGTFVGALCAPFIADNYGRKFAIIFSSFVVFMIGNSFQVAATRIPLLCVGRVITGLGVGIISAVVPMYQAEAAQKHMRGSIVSTYQWAITWGLLVASAVSQGTFEWQTPYSYRVPIILQYAWSLILGVGMIFLPESPRYYVLKDEIPSAARSLSILRSVPEDDIGLVEELVEIKANHDYELSFGSYSYIDCFRSGGGRSKQPLRIFTGMIMQAMQQVSGINFIFYYGVNFFYKTGLSNSYLVSFITYAVNVAFNIPSFYLVESIGRRKILLGGGIIMAIANIVIGIVGVSTDSVVANKVMIALICLFVAAFAAAWGPVVWVLTGELFSLGVRSKSAAICTASNWLLNLICATITPFLFDRGRHTSSMGTNIFFIWGGLNAVGVLVVYFTVYETQGLTLEQIDELYKLSPSSVASVKWNERIRMGYSRVGEADKDVSTNGTDPNYAYASEVMQLQDMRDEMHGPGAAVSFPMTNSDSVPLSASVATEASPDHGFDLHEGPVMYHGEFPKDTSSQEMCTRSSQQSCTNFTDYVSQLMQRSACSESMSSHRHTSIDTRRSHVGSYNSQEDGTATDEDEAEEFFRSKDFNGVSHGIPKL